MFIMTLDQSNHVHSYGPIPFDLVHFELAQDIACKRPCRIISITIEDKLIAHAQIYSPF